MRPLLAGRFRIALSSLAAVFCIGTIGYMLIEDWSFLDALYMTAITVSTVGYNLVDDLSTAGMIFTILLIVSGVGVMFYTATLVFTYVAEGQFGNVLWRRRMKEQIGQLKDHFIVCGYGRVGREVTSHIKEYGSKLVVIEADPEVTDQALKDGCLCIRGDVTMDDTLREAGIERARSLIAAVGNDVDNVYVTLSAREFRSDIFIAARASNDDSEYKLKRAGADRVIFPERLGGRRMAMTALRPWVVDFIDTTVYGHPEDFSLEHIRVSSDSPMAGLSVGEGQKSCSGVIILAIKKKDGYLVTHPGENVVVEPGDEVVVMGTQEQLRSLADSSCAYRPSGKAG